jgi:Tfp pilus assembly protein PilN
MPSINMIAPRRAEKQRLERDMRRLVLVILAELIVAVVLGGWACTKAYTMRMSINRLDAQIAKLKPVVKEIEQYENATKKLTPKMDLLAEAKDSTMRWYNSLDKLTQSLAASTYLTRISTSTDSHGKSTQSTISLVGISGSQERVGETIIRLQGIPDLENVDLHYTRKVNSNNRNGFEFEIGAVMSGDEPARGVSGNGTDKS